IVRGPKLPGDPASYAGPIALFDDSLINLATTSVKAYDLQMDYTLKTGRLGEFHGYALGTWQPNYKNQIAPGAAALERAGFSDGPVKLRGNLGIDWRRGPYAVQWNMQYYHSYLVYASTDPAALAAMQALDQGSARIPSQTYHDLIATYRFAGASGLRGALANSAISFGVENVFNKSPPTVAVLSPSSAGFSPYGDPRLRRWSLSIQKSF